MPRRLRDLLTALSLLLCVTVCVLWVRSYGQCDLLVRPSRAGDRACVTSEFGVVVFEWEAGDAGRGAAGVGILRRFSSSSRGVPSVWLRRISGTRPLEYGRPARRQTPARRSAPYVVFDVCALLAGLFGSWLRYSGGVEFTL